MANLTSSASSALTISVILNKSKGGTVESSTRGSEVLRTFVHNGSITAASDTGKFFASFRLVSKKSGEVPMAVLTGTKYKPVEQPISAKEFLANLYGGELVDTKFYINLSEDIVESIMDSECKAVKLTFSSDSLMERKDEEFRGDSAICFSIESAEVEVLTTYYGIGRRIDNSHVIAALEAAAEATTKGEVVTAQELAEKASKLTKNGKKKLIRELEEVLTPHASLLAEFKAEKLSSEPDELASQLQAYRVKLAQLNAASLGVAESTTVETPTTPDIGESRELTEEEKKATLLSLFD